MAPLSFTTPIQNDTSTFAGSFQFYRLPYGAIGCISHLLVYYAVVCLWFGRRPLMPFQRIKMGKIVILLGLVTLLTTIGIAVVTIQGCRSTWQLLVIGIWQAAMSFLNGITAIHVGYRAWRAPKEEKKRPGTRKFIRWSFLYILGTCAGMGGLMSLVVKNMDTDLKLLTVGFYGIAGGGIMGGVVREVCYKFFKVKGEKDYKRRLLHGIVQGIAMAFIMFAALSSFYSDWAIGMMVSDFKGLPTKNHAALYWTYVAVQRLPLLCW